MSSLYSYLALAGAIICEVTATTFLGKSEQFTRLVPTGLMVLFYGVSFYLLSLALKQVPLGVAYATWGGLGIVLTAVIGVVVFKQQLEPVAIAGIALIVIGVVMVQAFSTSVAH